MTEKTEPFALFPGNTVSLPLDFEKKEGAGGLKALVVWRDPNGNNCYFSREAAPESAQRIEISIDGDPRPGNLFSINWIDGKGGANAYLLPGIGMG